MEEAETPLPREETTPPVTKTYFVRWLAVAAVIPCFFVITPREVAGYDALWGRKMRVSNYGKKGGKNGISILREYQFHRTTMRVLIY